MKKKSLKIVKVGNVKIPIYRKQNRGRPIYMIRWTFNGKRNEFSRRALQEVESKAAEVATGICNGQTLTLTLTDEARIEYALAQKAIEGTGMSIASMAKEFALVHATLQGRSAVLAAEHYAREMPCELPKKSVEQALAEMLKHKESQNRARDSLRDLFFKIRAFGVFFPESIGSITPVVIRDYLCRFSAPKTKNNVRASLSTFLRWCRTAGYLPPDKAVATQFVERAMESTVRPAILSVDELKRLLEVTDYTVAPYIAIGVFAGVRTEEVLRLEWSDINWNDQIIDISEAVSKTRRHRTVAIAENLMAWLKPYRAFRGPIAPFTNTRKLLTLGSAKRAGVPWRRNALRHTYASYRYPILKSAVLLAEEMGNARYVVQKNYVKRGITAQEAERFWKIAPTAALARPLSAFIMGRLQNNRIWRAVRLRVELETRRGVRVDGARRQAITETLYEDMKGAPDRTHLFKPLGELVRGVGLLV